ncbi:hypothetical protein [Kribbella sp. NPDC048915]|uniref:hypothetical protein n=1 Tax=Kribbella sp. NPDC048915 TaxID=3155148 RepID=UPI0033EB4734
MTTDEPGTVYSWVHNNIWDTNFPSEQAFDQEFRYSIAFAPAGSGNEPSTHAMRLAATGSRPLRAVRCTGAATAGATYPLVALDNPGCAWSD